MTHQMKLVSEHEGTEEWYCPICGRRMLIEWQPWHKVVLELGDESTQHSGSKGGLSIGPIEINK